MKIKVKIQKHLAVAWKSEDSGEWVFTLCRRGLEELVGQRFKTGDIVELELNATFIKQIVKGK